MGWSVVVLILIIVVVVWTMAVIRNYVKRKLYPRDEETLRKSRKTFGTDGKHGWFGADGRRSTAAARRANRPRMTSRGMPLFND